MLTQSASWRLTSTSHESHVQGRCETMSTMVNRKRGEQDLPLAQSSDDPSRVELRGIFNEIHRWSLQPQFSSFAGNTGLSASWDVAMRMCQQNNEWCLVWKKQCQWLYCYGPHWSLKLSRSNTKSQGVKHDVSYEVTLYHDEGRGVELVDIGLSISAYHIGPSIRSISITNSKTSSVSMAEDPIVINATFELTWRAFSSGTKVSQQMRISSIMVLH